jgi:hypothetical protein
MSGTGLKNTGNFNLGSTWNTGNSFPWESPGYDFDFSNWEPDYGYGSVGLNPTIDPGPGLKLPTAEFQPYKSIGTTPDTGFGWGSLMDIGKIGIGAWGAWNAMQAGKTAEKAMKNNLALGRAGAQFGLEQARDIKVAREARNQASTGQLNRQQAYANAEKAVGYKTLADYGL